MNNGGEAADQMVRQSLQFAEVAIKLNRPLASKMLTPKSVPRFAAEPDLIVFFGKGENSGSSP